MQEGVPQQVFRSRWLFFLRKKWNSFRPPWFDSCFKTADSPKSMILISKLLKSFETNKMFSNFKSRWTMFCLESMEKKIRLVDYSQSCFKNSPVLKILFENIFALNPKQRWSAEQVLNSDWFLQLKPDCLPTISTPNFNKTNQSMLELKIIESFQHFQELNHLNKTSCVFLAHFSSPSRLSKLYQVFNVLDEDHSGTISLEEFQAFLTKHNVTKNEDIRRLFDTIDMDHSGNIQLTEFLAASLEAISGPNDYNQNQQDLSIL